MRYKASKYKSVKVAGYDSKKEHKRALELKILQTKGVIKDLKEQVTFELLPAQIVKDTKGKEFVGRKSMKYIADFTYYINGEYIVEDVKGYTTPEYKRKARLMKKIHNITIKET